MRCGMMMMLGFLCVVLAVHGQSASDLFAEGLALEKAFKVEEALAKYEAVLQRQPTHEEALWHASRMESNVGGHLKEKAAKRTHYEKAQAYAQKAIQLNPQSVGGRFAHIISMGLLSEIADNPREKIKNAKIIREEAETIVKLDSTFAPVYFVLGKWHYELAKLNWLEQLACDFFFGGMPEDVSMEKAIRHFERASTLDPDNILFLYGEASVYHYKKNYPRAKALLVRAVRLAPREPDDILRKEKCQAMLDQINEKS
ncbi:MAG: hypothetical protein JNL17_05340 [Cyclobacteriaceae bacterium]|nr:hypothetical protein [Cyclobacteriaceae bacterium]